MPEGPSIVILKEAIESFRGKLILDAWGTGQADMSALPGKKIREIRTLGKQMFIITRDITVRIHLLMFGTYSINEQDRPKSRVRLALIFKTGSIFFYTCLVRQLAGNELEDLDWESDVMSELWDPSKARKKVKKLGKTMIADALLNQEIFAGVGNIIKNEVLYRIRLHPETLVENIPARKMSELIREARNYSFEFLKWKKEETLRRHWEAHTQKICKRCDLPFIKKYTGRGKRRSFYCENCQVLYE